MTSARQEQRSAPILSMKIAEERDIVMARQRAGQLAGLLGFDSQEQVRLATSVSEIARNVIQYAAHGELVFSIDLQSRPQYFFVTVTDKGPGIADVDAVMAGEYESQSGMGIGLTGTRRLMPVFQIESKPGEGTTVHFGKPIPAKRGTVTTADLGNLCAKISQQGTSGAAAELQRQNRDLLQTLDVLRQREAELEKQKQELSRLNVELEETNRGVVALYAELDEKAVALRRADDMKSRFLWHVSHEFRTPLNSIQALSRLLLAHADGPLSAEQEKQVGYIRKAAGELTEMVNDLLDLAKVESGKAEIRMARVEVNQLLGSVRAVMRPLATNEAVRLVFEEPAAGLWMRTDEGKVSQILRNIISNALKFTQDGTVTVSASLTPDCEAVSFAVVDTGIGIAPENQAEIFQEFSQIENPIQRAVKGTGLGLPLSRKLAELLNGTLTVKSALGSGSEFTLTVPHNLRREESEKTQGGRERPTGSILLIDDDERARYLTRQLFAGTRHTILEASGGIEGSERARFELPVLIVLDLAMPDQSGFEVLEELKTNPATRNIPVVIQTSRRLSAADRGRISERALAILPKDDQDRRQALLAIREALREASLFAHEPEFASETG